MSFLFAARALSLREILIALPELIGLGLFYTWPFVGLIVGGFIGWRYNRTEKGAVLGCLVQSVIVVAWFAFAVGGIRG